jgi:hypothetical protein
MRELEIVIDLSRAETGAEAAREMLSDLCVRHDLSRWEYTDKVRIAPYEIPHSHPILTLNSQYAIGPGKDEDLFLATYIHEQLHWALDEYLEQETAQVIEIFKSRYPDFHKAEPLTAKDEYSTYLHILVNWLEYAIMTELVGPKLAAEVISKYRHYTKIYQIVVQDFAEIEKTLTKAGFLPLPQPR